MDSKSCVQSQCGLQLLGGLHACEDSQATLLLNQLFRNWHRAAPLCSLTGWLLSFRHLCLFLSLSSKLSGAHLTFDLPSCRYITIEQLELLLVSPFLVSTYTTAVGTPFNHYMTLCKLH